MNTAAIMNDLAEMLIYDGNAVEPKQLLNCALATRIEVLGQHHPSVLQTKHNLEVLYQLAEHIKEETKKNQRRKIVGDSTTSKFDIIKYLYFISILFCLSIS